MISMWHLFALLLCDLWVRLYFWAINIGFKMKLSDFFSKHNRTYTSSNYCLLKIIYLKSGLLSSLQKIRTYYLLPGPWHFFWFFFYYKISSSNGTFLFGCLLLFWENKRYLKPSQKTKFVDCQEVIFGCKISFDYTI